MGGLASIKVPVELFALAESSHFEGTYNSEPLQVGPDTYAFDTDIAWSVDVTNTGEALLVMGTCSARATTSCARCLEDVVYDLEGQIDGYFLINEDSVVPEDMGEDEMQVLPADHIIDIRPLVNVAFMMDLDDVPLCRDDCAGLCPNCGANLNEGPCGCGEDADLAQFEKAANPFAALAGFKF